jgi:gluconate 2-dehydrogenase gamma chain
MAGMILYIDRQLASSYGRDRHRYTQPPFEDGVPEQGYQGKATPRELYREGLVMLSGFDGLLLSRRSLADLLEILLHHRL